MVTPVASAKRSSVGTASGRRAGHGQPHRGHVGVDRAARTPATATYIGGAPSSDRDPVLGDGLAASSAGSKRSTSTIVAPTVTEVAEPDVERVDVRQRQDEQDHVVAADLEPAGQRLVLVGGEVAARQHRAPRTAGGARGVDERRRGPPASRVTSSGSPASASSVARRRCAPSTSASAATRCSQVRRARRASGRRRRRRVRGRRRRRATPESASACRSSSGASPAAAGRRPRRRAAPRRRPRRTRRSCRARARPGRPGRRRAPAGPRWPRRRGRAARRRSRCGRRPRPAPGGRGARRPCGGAARPGRDPVGITQVRGIGVRLTPIRPLDDERRLAALPAASEGLGHRRGDAPSGGRRVRARLAVCACSPPPARCSPDPSTGRSASSPRPGYDGAELMVTQDPATQDAERVTVAAAARRASRSRWCTARSCC